jgi:CDGSH-type Zn-finger protein
VSEVTIQVRENGPLKVTGPVTLVDAEGVPFELPAGTSFVLCRCGHSGNKPFCDATHRKIGFEAVETAPRAS